MTYLVSFVSGNEAQAQVLVSFLLLFYRQKPLAKPPRSRGRGFLSSQNVSVTRSAHILDHVDKPINLTYPLGMGNSLSPIRFGEILHQPTTWQVNRSSTCIFSHMTFLMVFLPPDLKESAFYLLRGKQIDYPHVLSIT